MLKIDLTKPDMSVLSGHLKMGGTNPQGVEINANNRYLTLAGKPWLPVMGEFHFARYPNQDWRDELLKMKAGGIQIVANYIFWIHHEEIEGQFDWEGNRDLRRFTALCGELGLYSYPRIGPWDHGECRNGGFPDWVVARCGDRARQDDPEYLDYVRRLYGEIAVQLKGLLWKEGGPVVGIQLENELANNAGHIATLKRLALEAGLDVPLYTMTGWGPAQIPPGDEVIPVFGGYPDAFWDREVDGWSRASRKHYFFNPLRDDSTIGADLLKAEGMPDLTYLEHFPFATCELGGGMQVAYHRRPYIEADDVAALAMTKVGCGNNLQGYYMYHGGSHPLGKLSTMQESQATGYWNDVPTISYDFQAPLREYGQVNASYHSLRLLHLFLNDFGSQLAPMPAALPEWMPSGLDNRQTLRWAVRSDGRAGFIFINNYQREESLPAHNGVQFELDLLDEVITLPLAPLGIPAGKFMIWPFNLDLGGVRLKYATAQLVCQVDDQDTPCFVFAARGNVAPEFAFAANTVTEAEGTTFQSTQAGEILLLQQFKPGPECTLTILGTDGRRIRLLLLAEEQAYQCWKAEMWGQARLFLSSAALLFDGDQLRLRSNQPGDQWLEIYPLPTEQLAAPAGARRSPVGSFVRFDFKMPVKNCSLISRRVKAAAPARPVEMGPLGVAQAPEDADFAKAEVWEVRLPPDILDGVHEVYLYIDYAGDAARAYLGDVLVADDFYYGRTWEIGLRRFAPDILKKPLTLKFLPLRKDAPIYLRQKNWPYFGTESEVLRVRRIAAVGEYELTVAPNT